jgi:multiple sugar transport system substrate-binding protein
MSLRVRMGSPSRSAVALAGAIVLLTFAASSAARVDGSQYARSSKTTLVVWHYFTTPGQLAALKNAAKRFNAVNPNVTVKYEFKPFDQMTPAVLAAAAAHKGPDVLIYQWGDMLKVRGAGALKNMTPYFNTYVDKRKIPSGVIHTVGKKIFTISPYVNLLALYYNADLLSKYNLAPPTTLDQLQADMKTITGATKSPSLLFDGTGGTLGWWTGMPFLWANGVDIHMKDQSRIASAFTQLKSWIDAGYVDPQVVTLQQPDVMNKFLAGNIAFAVNGNWELAHAKSAAQFQWGTVKMPAGTASSHVYLGGEGIALGGYGKNAAVAWNYITTGWLSKKAQAALPSTIGSLPVRTDLINDPAITKTHGLQAFAKEVATGYPLPLTPGEIAAQVLFGDTYSAVLAGQTSPSDAAAKLFSQTPGLLGGK